MFHSILETCTVFHSILETCTVFHSILETWTVFVCIVRTDNVVCTFPVYRCIQKVCVFMNWKRLFISFSILKCFVEFLLKLTVVSVHVSYYINSNSCCNCVL